MSVTKNFIYNLIYQLLIVLIPIILIPYVSNTLKTEGVGIYTYSFSIVTYFSQFALFGVYFYGTKKISQVKEDLFLLKKTFWEIFYLKLIFTVISISIYFTFTFLTNNTFIFYLQGLFLLANLLDITWYYAGDENFKSIVLKNSSFKLLMAILIFIFIKNPNDLWKYTLIVVGIEIISQLILWIDVFKSPLVFEFDQKLKLNPFNHFKGMLYLFIPQIIVLLYTELNVIILGLLSNNTEVAYFGNTAKVVNSAAGIVTTLGMVMIPRVGQLYLKNENNKIKRLLKKSLDLSSYMAYPLMLIIMVLSPLLVSSLFGSDWQDMTNVLVLFSLKIIIVIYSNVTAFQYLVATNRNKHYIIAVSIGAITTLTLNLFLIPKYGALGTVIASLIAEFLLTLYLILKTYKEIPFHKYIVKSYKTIISSLLMALVVLLSNKYFLNNLGDTIKIVADLLIATTLYIFINFVIKNEIQNDIFKRIKTLF